MCTCGTRWPKSSHSLDSRVTENFVDKWEVKTLRLGTKVLTKPLGIHNVDRITKKGEQITRYTNLWVWQGQSVVMLQFYVTNLGQDHLISGFLSFRNFNPDINWLTRSLPGDKVCIETAGYQSKKQQSQTLARRSQPKPIKPQIFRYYHCHTHIFNEQALYHFSSPWDKDCPITLKPDPPSSLNCNDYAQTKEEAEATKEFMNDHIKKGYIAESNSPYTSLFFFRKKKDGKLQPIMDYRVLNSLAIWDTYPLPLINTILEQLQGKELFRKFDIWWGYNNIQIKEEDQWKAALKTPFRSYQLCIMFIGLTNSPATFCCTMACMFWELTNKYSTELFVYMNDILIATKDDLDWHRKIVDKVLDLLAKESYFLQPAKCIIEQTHVEYLGLIVDGGKLSIDLSKAEGLRDWPQTLTKVKEVQSVLGVLGYQHPFIPNYATIAKPLTDLTRKDHPFSWTPECQNTLDTLINTVLSNLSLWRPDPIKPFTLQVNTFEFATGAILTQQDARGKSKAVGYHSQTFLTAERN